MRDILPAEAELRDVDRRHHPGRLPPPWLPPRRDPGAREPPAPDRGWRRREREAHLQGAQARREARPWGRTPPRPTWRISACGSTSRSRWPATTRTTRGSCPTRFKAVQIGPVWRAERPQRGRYRQFTQCDIDIVGVSSEIAEIELILATTEALGELGLGGLTVRVNDRRLLATMASWCGFAPERHASVFITLDKWDKLSPSRGPSGARAGGASGAGHRADAGAL